MSTVKVTKGDKDNWSGKDRLCKTICALILPTITYSKFAIILVMILKLLACSAECT